MNANCYSIMWGEDEDELSVCFMSGFTIAEVDEGFARMYPASTVWDIQLLGEFLVEGGE